MIIKNNVILVNGKPDIRQAALTILDENPEGMQYTSLLKSIQNRFPTVPLNTIRHLLWNLDAKFPGVVHKPKRGLFQLCKNGLTPEI